MRYSWGYFVNLEQRYGKMVQLLGHLQLERTRQATTLSSNVKHNLDKNYCSSASKKTRRCIFLYFARTKHVKILVAESTAVRSDVYFALNSKTFVLFNRCFDLVEK